VVGGVFDCGDLDVGAVGGLQVVAGVEVFRLDPLTGLGYPERVPSVATTLPAPPPPLVVVMVISTRSLTPLSGD
jgi:hypothetical protein